MSVRSIARDHQVLAIWNRRPSAAAYHASALAVSHGANDGAPRDISSSKAGSWPLFVPTLESLQIMDKEDTPLKRPLSSSSQEQGPSQKLKMDPDEISKKIIDRVQEDFGTNVLPKYLLINIAAHGGETINSAFQELNFTEEFLKKNAGMSDQLLQAWENRDLKPIFNLRANISNFY